MGPGIIPLELCHGGLDGPDAALFDPRSLKLIYGLLRQTAQCEPVFLCGLSEGGWRDRWNGVPVARMQKAPR